MTENEVVSPITGAFISSLKRSNKEIREDRADTIAKTARLKYKRKIEDLEMRLDALKTERNNMLDMSPSNAQSLIVAAEFNGEQFLERDMDLSLEIREKEIELEIAKQRCEYLFGGNV